MGTGYKGNSTHFHSLSENLSSISKIFKLNNGYFGIKAKKNKGYIRHIAGEDPIATSKLFFDTLAYGGIIKDVEGINGEVVYMKDGSILTWRIVSSSDGSPAVDINVNSSYDSGGIKNQKIHFIKGEFNG